jgi:hypothetical protein
MLPRRYPKIHIRSKAELARHLSDVRMSRNAVLRLINDCLDNFDKYWTDHPIYSEPKKDKWVRDASRTNLGKLLKLIDAKVLKPQDKELPNFIFGGVSKLNHKAAVQHLLGRRRKRVLLKLDISRFFEQNRDDRVFNLFKYKFECGEDGSKLLTKLCCVPFGRKDEPSNYQTIARGFPTSPRLSVWCNLDAFIKIDRLIKKELKGKDPRLAIYVDDIGVTASKVTKEDMMRLYPKIRSILESDEHHKLPLNDAKTKIIYHSGETFDIEGGYQGKFCFEHLGTQMNRNSLMPGTKSRWKLVGTVEKYKASKGTDKTLKTKRKAMLGYKAYIRRK